MTRPYAKRPPLLAYAIMAGLCTAVFAADLLTDRTGMETWIFYLAPLGLALFTWRPRAPIWVATTCTALLVAGFFQEPGALQGWRNELNRGFFIIALWVIALVGRQLILSKMSLAEQNWLRTGQNDLGAAVGGEQSLAELGQSILGFLSRYLGAHVGALYVRDGDGALARAATYALAPDSASARFEVGEGLVGQAARDRRPLRIRRSPPGYLEVTSALGSAPPLDVIVIPTRIDSEVNAVVELGFVEEVDTSVMELLALLEDAIAVAVRSAVYRAQLVELLAQTQKQAELLHRQQEELQVTNEELQEQSNKLISSQEALERQQTELEQTNAQLEEQTQILEQQKTDLLRTQQAITAQAAELSRASRYKSEFLANMSHELRTPLNSAIILSKLLAENKDGNLNEEQIKFAETVYSANNDLLALIDDILDLSKIEAGRVDVRAETVMLAQLGDTLERTFSPLAQEKRLGWTLTVAPDVPATIETDGQRLRQVLKNLLSNAFKFTDEGAVALEVAAAGDRVAFSVTDTGIGIPASQQQVIFEAFRQADGTTNRRHGGTGLGLSISRDLARLLGGDIALESAPGRGSTFRLVIPRSLPESAPQQRRQPAAVTPVGGAATPTSSGAAARADMPAWDDRDELARGARTILVIEDDPRFAEILYDLAHEKSFACMVAATATEGVRLALTHTPSAILLDIGLPDGSGLAVLEQLKRDPRTRHIPVHVVSVANCTETALAMGAIGYELKPVTREELAAAFEKLEAKLNQRIKRLLVVEDDSAARDAIVALLEARDVDIVAVASAEEALARLKQSSFDCMVTDLRLPDASGGELLEQMSRDESCSFPPVIVYTGRDLSADEEQQLGRYSRSIIIKGARSPERLLDEVTLFLHQVESSLPIERQRMLRAVRNREEAFDGRRILVVEDDVRNLFALSSILEPKGARIEVARNGREALEALDATAEVDLVLMDIMMPEMDGLQAMREIRKQERWEKLPIIALTAKAMPDDLQICRAAGASDYMAKPVEVDKLLSLMRVWLR